MIKLAFAVALLASPAVATPTLAASAPAVEGARGMVVTSQRIASEVGADILRRGGNAVDAAVAVGYAQAVVNPCCGNIGGGGFMVLHLADGRDRFINFREMAPAAATADMYLDSNRAVISDASLFGSRAAGVPGTVMGLEAAREKYGTMDRATLIAPAVGLAQDGFTLTRGDTDILDSKVADFRKSPAAAPLMRNPFAPVSAPSESFAAKPDAFPKTTNVLPDAWPLTSAASAETTTSSNPSPFTSPGLAAAGAR